MANEVIVEDDAEGYQSNRPGIIEKQLSKGSDLIEVQDQKQRMNNETPESTANDQYKSNTDYEQD